MRAEGCSVGVPSEPRQAALATYNEAPLHLANVPAFMNTQTKLSTNQNEYAVAVATIHTPVRSDES